MTFTSALKDLLQLSDPVRQIDEQEFLDALETAHASLNRTDLTEHYRRRLHDALHDLEAWWLSNQAAWGPNYLSRARRGLPDANQTRAGVNRIRGKLRRMLTQLEAQAPSTDAVVDQEGFTARSLMKEAGIKKDTWQKIVSESSIPKTQPGQHSRRFSYAEVRKLAATAKQTCPRVGGTTAQCWLEMVERNLKA